MSNRPNSLIGIDKRAALAIKNHLHLRNYQILVSVGKGGMDRDISFSGHTFVYQ